MLFMAGCPPGRNWLAAITEIEFGKPLARLVVPSIGSTATSKRGAPRFQVPSLSPRNSPGALSFAPSPITTSPAMSTRSNTPLIASQAAASAFSFSPRPSQGSTLRAAFSVARTNSNSIVRSGSVAVKDSSIIPLQRNTIPCHVMARARQCRRPLPPLPGNGALPRVLLELRLFRQLDSNLGILVLRRFYPLKANEVVLLEELRFLDLLEPRRQNLPGENFLPGSDVV